jgi:hypothetical protein
MATAVGDVGYAGSTVRVREALLVAATSMGVTNATVK